MKLQPFAKMIGKSKEAIDEAMAPVRAKMVKSKAEVKKVELEDKILQKQSTIQEMCLEKDINLELLMDRLDEVALLERRLVQYDEVLAQLFPSRKK